MACPLARTPTAGRASSRPITSAISCSRACSRRCSSRARPSRVISVSSRGHRFSPVVFDDIHFERRPYDKWSAYGQSKTANVLFAVELDRPARGQARARERAAPGRHRTELGRHLTQDDIKELMSRAPAARWSGRRPSRAPRPRLGRDGARARGQGRALPRRLPDRVAAHVRGRSGGYEAYARDAAARSDSGRCRKSTWARRSRLTRRDPWRARRRQGGDRDGRGVGHRPRLREALAREGARVVITDVQEELGREAGQGDRRRRGVRAPRRHERGELARR
jgi:NAD(P)-dependent dehydrogenase (short-subunit alcohol dehydrogenase family)